MTTLIGLPLDVYRDAAGMDATRNGVTSTHTRLTLVGTIDHTGTLTPSPLHSRQRPATEDAPAVALREHAGMAHLVPVDADGAPVGGRWYMAGGNYATGDSRVGDYYAQLGLEPIYGATPVHDRSEH